MVDLVSKIKLLFTSQGAGKAAASVGKVGKAQENLTKQTKLSARATTRQASASASASRQFSAQASGLGGLVAAYAGAAATIFAVTQAFAALQRAAQAEQIVQGTRALALEVGASGDEIIAKIQEITKGQLSLAEAAQSANIALSAGFGEKQIERLTAVALKASRALGRTLTDALTRITRGAAKLEPELLDELGIFVRIEPAVKKYAASLNRAVSSLTSFERRQAFGIAILEEGERKLGIIDTSTQTTLESFERLSAKFQDLAANFGQIIGAVLSPLVELFSKSLGNSLLIFLGVASLVFAKAMQIFSAFVAKSIAKFVLWVSTSATATKATIAQTIAVSYQNKVTAFNTLVTNANTGAKVANTVATRAATRVAAGLAVTMSFLGGVLATVVIAVGAAQLIGTLFDVDVIGEIVDWFKNLGAEARKTEAGIRGVVAAATMDEDIAKRLKKNFDPDELEEIVEVAADALSARLFVRPLGELSKMPFSFLPGKREEVAAEIIAKINKELGVTIEYQKGLADTKGLKIVGEQSKALTFAATRAAQIMIKLAEAQYKLDNETNVEKQRDLHKEIEGLNLALKQTLDRSTQIGRLAEEMSKLTGLPVQRLVIAFNEAGTVFERAGDELKYAGHVVAEFDKETKEFEKTELWKGFQRGISATTMFNDQLTLIQDAFDRGAISAETMSQKVKALDSIAKGLEATTKEGEGLEKFRKELKRMGIDGTVATDVINAFGDEAKRLGTEVDDLAEKADKLKMIEKMEKNLRKIVQETDKLNSELDKTLLKLEQTKKLLDLKDRLADTKGQIDNINKALKRQTDLRKLDEKLIKSRIEKIKTTLKYDQEDLEILERQNEERAAAAAAAESLANARRTLAAAQGERAGAAALGAAEADLGQMTRNQELYTAEEIRQGKEKVIQIEYQNAMDVLNRQKKQAEIEHGIKIRELSDEYALQQEKTATLERQQGLQENLFTEQDRLLASQRAQEDAASEAAKRKLYLQGQQIIQERNIAIQTARNAAESAKKQNELRKTQAENIKAQAKMFLGAIVGLDDTFDKFLEGVSLLAKMKGVDATKVETALDKEATTEILKKAIEDADKIVDKTTDIGKKIDANLEKEEEAANKAMRSKLQNNTLDMNHLLEIARRTKALRLAEDDALKEERSRVLENLQIKLDVSKQEAENILNAVEAEQTLQEAREVGFAAQAEGEKRNRQLKLQALEEERNLILRVSRAISQKLTDRLGNALRSLNTAIMEGTLTMENFKQGFKDFLVGVITDIQSTIFEEIVVKPIQDWVRTGVRTLAKNLAKNLLGITLPDTVEESAVEIAKNTKTLIDTLNNEGLKVRVTNAAEICACMGDSGQLMVDDRPATGGFNTRRDGGPGSGGRIRDLGGALQLDPISVTAPLLTQNTRDFYTELGSVKSTISEMPTVLSDLNVALQESGINLGQVGATAALTFGGILAATGDFGTALLSTFIQIFTQIIAQSFASSFSFAASGGLIGKHMDVMGVQRLQSGGSVAYRDRVPALLEPGEFVIRKPIARQIGGPALERMNATGAGGGGMPEISVNVKNEGTPKQGDASVQPSFDPKEFVVDIVLKDLRNNGPIKQSMRSGTGRR